MTGKACIFVGLVLVVLASAGCQRDQGQGEKIQTVVLGKVQIGKESTEIYIAYARDAAILGFSVSTGGPSRYFPMYTSTDRGIPSVVLEVFASKSEEEMWVRSSWSGGEILAYHRVGADNALTQFGNVMFLKEPMPENLGGSAVPFPALIMENVVKKATFKHDL